MSCSAWVLTSSAADGANWCRGSSEAWRSNDDEKPCGARQKLDRPRGTEEGSRAADDLERAADSGKGEGCKRDGAAVGDERVLPRRLGGCRNERAARAQTAAVQAASASTPPSRSKNAQNAVDSKKSPVEGQGDAHIDAVSGEIIDSEKKKKKETTLASHKIDAAQGTRQCRQDDHRQEDHGRGRPQCQPDAGLYHQDD